MATARSPTLPATAPVWTTLEEVSEHLEAQSFVNIAKTPVLSVRHQESAFPSLG